MGRDWSASSGPQSRTSWWRENLSEVRRPLEYDLNPMSFEVTMLPRYERVYFKIEKAVQKREVGKFWVGKSEARKFSFKLESGDRSWLVLCSIEVIENFPTLTRTIELHSFQFEFELSNFSIFPTALANYYMYTYELSVDF